jgi:hypothetical protein
VSDGLRIDTLLAHQSCLLVPPYGAEAANLQTIFDVKHLEKRAYFLGIQCEQHPFHRLHLSLMLMTLPQTGFLFPWASLSPRGSITEGCGHATRSQIIRA